jgi:hypothetical protein
MEPFFAEVYQRLASIHADIDRTLAGLPPEAVDWSPGPEMNSVAVLVAHTAGAERYLLGDVIAREPTGRVREAEFATAGKDLAALRDMLAEALLYSKRVLDGLTPADLDTQRVSPASGRSHSVAWALLHALDHAAEHMGHIQMTGQLWEARQARS